MDICNNRGHISVVFVCFIIIEIDSVWGILDIANNARYEADGPFVCIYVKSWLDLC